MFSLKSAKIRKFTKGITSLLLVLSVMLSLAVPFNITSFAAAAAEGEDICAYLRYVNPGKVATNSDSKENKNLELVFARKENKPADAIASYENNFADKEFITTIYAFDSSGRVGVTYYYTYDTDGTKFKDNTSTNQIDAWKAPDLSKVSFTPWYNNPLCANNNNIRKITFKDKIAPKYMAGWFLRCQYLTKVEGINNLDTSKCENMSFMFWYSNTSTANYTENNVTTNSAYLKELDLSSFDTSNVKKIDYFMYQPKLEDLNVSGFDLSGVKNNVSTVKKYGDKYPTKNYSDMTDENGNFVGAVRDIRYFVYGGITNSLNVDNVDLSEVEYLRYFIANTKLPVIDVSKVKGPKHAYGCEYMFQNNTQLTNLILGDDTHNLEIGTEPTYMGIPRYGRDNPFSTKIETGISDNASDKANNNYNPVRSQTIWIGNFVSGCTSLKTIDLKHLKLNLDGSEYPKNHTDDEGRLTFWDYGVIYQLNSFFNGCTALEKINNIDKICFKSLGNGNWITRSMFDNCLNLETIDMGSYKGYIGGPWIFRGCSNLKELNLASMGMALDGAGTWNNYWIPRRGFASYNASSNVYLPSTIYMRAARSFQRLLWENTMFRTEKIHMAITLLFRLIRR